MLSGLFLSFSSTKLYQTGTAYTIIGRTVDVKTFYFPGISMKVGGNICES